MRGRKFHVCFVMFLIVPLCLPGCVERVTVPPDSGEVVETPSELPGANEPYTVEGLESEKSEASELGEAVEASEPRGGPSQPEATAE